MCLTPPSRTSEQRSAPVARIQHPDIDFVSMPAGSAHGHRRTSRGQLPQQVVRRTLQVALLIAVGWLGSASSVQADPAAVLALAKSVEEVLSNIQLWLLGILGSLATLFLSFGGARYLAAGGDPGEVSKAKLALKCAGVGYVVALLAPLIVEILKRIVGAGP
ncbi:hypothetical protein GCM10010452_03140 [Crossiella cryophila]